MYNLLTVPVEKTCRGYITMNSTVGSAAPSGDLASSTTTPEVSLFRLYTLRVAYFVMAAGLGVYIWPLVIHHTNELAVTKGAQLALLAGLGGTAALGLRYPVKMLPILPFEMVWKAVYLIAFALPLSAESGPTNKRAIMHRNSLMRANPAGTDAWASDW